jgi:hypothetical protein
MKTLLEVDSFDEDAHFVVEPGSEDLRDGVQKQKVNQETTL